MEQCMESKFGERRQEKRAVWRHGSVCRSQCSQEFEKPQVNIGAKVGKRWNGNELAVNAVSKVESVEKED